VYCELGALGDNPMLLANSQQCYPESAPAHNLHQTWHSIPGDILNNPLSLPGATAAHAGSFHFAPLDLHTGHAPCASQLGHERPKFAPPFSCSIGPVMVYNIYLGTKFLKKIGLEAIQNCNKPLKWPILAQNRLETGHNFSNRSPKQHLFAKVFNILSQATVPIHI